MPRGRLSVSARDSPVSERTDSPDTSFVSASGRVTRSGSTRNPSVPRPTTTKSTRGRSTRASLLANESLSSLPASTEFTSASEYSTPATSNVATPAPSVAADGPSKATRSGKLRTSIEVRIPTVGLAESEKGLRRSQYSMKPASKRKLGEIRNSDDEDEDEDFPDETADAILARRLQNEEYNKAEDSSESLPMLTKRRIVKASASSPPQNSYSSPSLVTGRSRSSQATAYNVGPPSKKSKMTEVDDSDDDLSEPLSSEPDDEPVVGDSEAEELGGDSYESSDSDDEIEQPPARRRTAKTPKKPLATSKAKGKGLATVTATRATRKPRAPRARATETSKRGTKRMDLSESDEDSLDSDSAPLSSKRRAAVKKPEADEQSASSDFDPEVVDPVGEAESAEASDSESAASTAVDRIARGRRAYRRTGGRRVKRERDRLETHHPEILTMWKTLEDMPVLKAGRAPQPTTISRQLKPFQLEGLAWMMAMEQHEWKGGLLGDEMGLGKTIQAVSLIMSDFPAKLPSLVLVPPVALMQWVSEIASYTDGTLNTFVFHGTNSKTKGITVKDLKKHNVIIMSYNSLESMYRKQEKGFKRKDGIYKAKSLIHQMTFHRVILDEAHSIKTRTTMTAKACFALKVNYRWCLTGTPLQNRIGEFFSLIRFLNIRPFASYLCKQCPCTSLEWNMNAESRCRSCDHAGVQHVSVFNQELLNPIQKYGNMGPGKEALRKLRLMTERIMLRRLKKDHTNSMELPVKEIYVDRQFFGEEENDFANSIMTNGQRRFETYVAQGVLLNNYANIFGLIMQMRQVADHPDLILKKNAEGGQNILVCCICDEPAEDTIRSRCKHDFCRTCAKSYLLSSDEPDCPQCHIPLSIDLEQPEIEQEEGMVKKSSIINRIKMENWTSSSKIELLVHELHKLRSNNASHKSIIFSQFTTMLQLIEWRLRRAGFTTVMLDGSMTPAQRQASIEHFMTNVDVEVFLVSLKAGGVALNLTEASRVFIVDPWWNPAAEWQSADRCHRIGQTRPCTITRLCIEDSVESRMVLIQEKKTNMIHSTVNADDKAMESLSPEDMQFLFRGS